MRGRYFGGLSLTTALVSGLIAFPGYAQDATWNNPANGSYSFYGNWNTGSAPVSNDTATFSGTPSSTVTLDAASVTVGNVVVNDIGAIKNGTFDFNSGSASTLTYSDTDSTALASSLTLNLNGADLTVTATENMDFAGAIKNTGAAATLSLDTTAVMTLSGVISDATAVTVGSGAVTLSGTNTYTGATTVSAGTLNIGSAAALGASTSVTVNTPGTLDLNGFDTTAAGLSGDGTITNDNGGAGNAVLTVSGAAFSGSVQDGTSDTLGLTLDNALETDVFALSGTNSYSGDTTIETGILVISGGSAIHDDGLVTVTADSTLRVDASEDVGLLSGAGSVDLNGAGVTLTLGDTGGGAQTHSGVISGAGNLAMAGGGTQTLSGANTYTGATTVTAGTLVLNNAGGMALADSTAVTVTGTLDVQSSETIGTLAGAGTVDVNSNTLTLAGAGDTTFSGTLAGAGTLAKIGGDTLTLSGDNTAYTGGFTISGTSTIAGGANAFGTGAGAIALDNGTLNVTATSTVANAITVAAAGGAI
ncbi:hypothetical protein HKX58_16270, partial [Sulfitobacter sp. M60]|nr:hypothetical protein [Sulfitobacter sp. M60]